MITSGLRVSGCKATTKIKLEEPLSEQVFIIANNPIERAQKVSPFYLRVLARFMSENDFIENHASGTLRKNKRLGFDYKGQYLHERIAFDFGYGFEAKHETHINWGKPITEGDCHAITEAGWFIDRYQFFAFPGDEFEAKHIEVHQNDNTTREGVGIIIRKTSAPYLPDNFVVFSLIAETDKLKHDYLPTINPC